MKSEITPSQKNHDIACKFDFTKTQKATIYLDLIQKEVYIQWNGKKYELLDITKEIIDSSSFFAENIDFDDLNFDGYQDISIALGDIDASSDVLRDYYFYDPKRDSFFRYVQDASMIQKHQEVSIFSSHKKHNEGTTHKYYNIDSNGRPFLFMQGESCWTNEKEDDAKTSYTIKGVSIKSEQVFMYDDWYTPASKQSINKERKIKKVLDFVGFKGAFLVKIMYEDQDKTYTTWINFKDLIFEEMIDENKSKF
ncbi:MAG: hypothetical protein JXQ68_05125 [Campylobacterales bacterium]|nr:hypothetical protein [Campylobacterales bacterium]